MERNEIQKAVRAYIVETFLDEEEEAEFTGALSTRPISSFSLNFIRKSLEICCLASSRCVVEIS